MVVLMEVRADWPISEDDLALIAHDLFHGPERLTVDEIAVEIDETPNRVRELLEGVA